MINLLLKIFYFLDKIFLPTSEYFAMFFWPSLTAMVVELLPIVLLRMLELLDVSASISIYRTEMKG